MDCETPLKKERFRTSVSAFGCRKVQLLWIVVMLLLFVTTPVSSQSARTSSQVKNTSNKNGSSSSDPSNDSPAAAADVESSPKNAGAAAMALRGGAGLAGILLFPVNLVKSYVADHTFGSFVTSHTILIAKGAVIVFVSALFMAYLGVIGDHEHHLQDWVIEKESKFLAFVRKLGFHPRGFLRMKLQGMLNNFRSMPPRPKFASAVSLGTTAFPLIVNTVAWTVRIVVGGFLFAEVLALLGVLGKPGEGLEKWVEEGGSEPLVRSIRRGIDEARLLLRQKLQVQEILNNFLESLRKDDIYWLGFTVGALASMLIKDNKE